MAAETAILVTIATTLATAVLDEVSKKLVEDASESSTVAGLKSIIFKGFELEVLKLSEELCKLDAYLNKYQNIDPMKCDKNDLFLLWLKKVKVVARFAYNLFDEMAYEATQKKVMIRRSRFERVTVRAKRHSVFRILVSRRIMKFMCMTNELYKEGDSLKLAEIVGKGPSYLPETNISRNLNDLRENPDTSLFIGRQDDEKLIVSQLCSSNDNGQHIPVIAIVATSGVGKTTLARMIYENKSVVEHFSKRTWIFVSDNFSLVRFLDEMLQSVTGQSHNLSNKCAMEEQLQRCLQEEEKGHLLVLDDVWNTDEQLWESVENSLIRVTRSTRCTVLVTTQNSNVALAMRASLTHCLTDLSDACAWRLFTEIAFANKTREQVTDLEDVGRRILSKCGGLPLAIKTLGSLLGSMDEKSGWESVEESEIWDLLLDKSKITPWLLLSFHHLPDAKIKQCFVHCSVSIEKGTSLNQSKLIQAWMAQGFIQSPHKSEMSMEDVGETYVRTLVATGLLQMDNRSDGRYLWMHDLVHALAHVISGDTCLIVTRKANNLQDASEVEHLRICGESAQKFVYNIQQGEKLSKLSTLICTQATLSVEFVTQARFLRDLQLIDCGLEELPSSIWKLKHLKYLSVRKNPLRFLPASIGTLFNLQTIDLDQCYDLVEMPQEITMLLNLRHIFIRQYLQMPKGMGQLNSLKTVPDITLREKEGLEIEELNDLPLSGEIAIRGLEHVSCKEDVANANFRTKSGITSLTLEWSYERQDAYMDCVVDEEIMDGLYPHSNLKGISVRNFGSKRLSSWLSNMSNLKTVILVSCYQCDQLPALGQLRFVEEIHIDAMDCLEVIGSDFYVKDDGNEGSSRTSPGAYSAHNGMTKRILFPRLKRLTLRNMPKLIHWVHPSESTYDIFPSLEQLEIYECPLLISAPTCFRSLLSLSISHMKSGGPLLMILNNSLNLTALDITGIEQLTSLSHLLKKCTSLKTMKISSCKDLVELCPSLRYMGSLENLQVMSCDSLSSFPDIEGSLSLRVLRIMKCNALSTLLGLERCVSLETLILERNSNLYLFPDLTNLTHLKLLTATHFARQMWIPVCLSHLLNLRYLEIGSFSNEVDQLHGIKHLPKCLKKMSLYKWPKVNFLPNDLRFFNQLEFLCIEDFGVIEMLPEWLGELFSLQKLQILGCEKLKYLPSMEEMRRLNQLRELEIYDCPILKERCYDDGGEEWHKISHLSYITIDDHILKEISPECGGYTG